MNENSAKKSQAWRQKLWASLHQTIAKVNETASAYSQQGADASSRLVKTARQTSQAKLGTIQRKLGEDYYAILNKNPLVLDTLSRSELLIENKKLLSTIFNVPWTTTLLWGAAASGALGAQKPLSRLLGREFHYKPGHAKYWQQVSAFMDQERGKGHRLKFGHSIDHLPQIVEKFGIEAVPGYFLHLLQDALTVDGIPILPRSWEVKTYLQEVLQISPQKAVGLVSINFSKLLGMFSAASFIANVWQLTGSLIKNAKLKSQLKIASAALQSRDYNAAIANYQHALELERSPFVLMALGQAQMQRATSRLRAHKTFTEAVTLLADRPALAVPYFHAKLSVRGLAGIQALATVDVLVSLHPEHWNDHVEDLVNATVFSFSSTAQELARQRNDLVPDLLVTPALFSAALNYYLAAKAACYFPLADERQEIVTRNLQAALQSLTLLAQYDEEQLRPATDTIRRLWAMELLPENEFEQALTDTVAVNESM